MRFARDFNGFLIDAEVNNTHGNFICLQCHNLAHWRKESVDQRRPHFYHAVANEDCPLSVIGGKWNLVDSENVEFYTELNNEKIIFKRKTKPDFSKIPIEHITNSDYEKQLFQTIMKIRLTSSEVAQIDFTVALFCKFFDKQKVNSYCAIPLPVKIIRAKGIDSSEQIIHRRLVQIIGTTPELVENLCMLNIPENVNVEIGTYIMS